MKVTQPANWSVASEGMMEKTVASCLPPVQVLTHGKGPSRRITKTIDQLPVRHQVDGPYAISRAGALHNFADLAVRSHGAADLRERLSQRTLATLLRASRMERRISLLHMHQASSAEKQARLCGGASSHRSSVLNASVAFEIGPRASHWYNKEKLNLLSISTQCKFHEVRKSTGKASIESLEHLKIKNNFEVRK